MKLKIQSLFALQIVMLIWVWPCRGALVSNITATASSRYYWEITPTVIVDRKEEHTVDFSGLTANVPPQHFFAEGTAWVSVGNGYTSQNGAPGGDDPAPWIQFLFPQTYTISSVTIWNYGERPRAIYKADLFAGSTFVSRLQLNTNLNVFNRADPQTFQLPSPVTASSFKLVVVQNGGGVTFPTTETGFSTLAGLGEVQFNIAPTIEITSVQTPTTVGNDHSFISTDLITLQATVKPAVANKQVKWTVTGKNAAANISGFANQEVHNTDGAGLSTFTFRPSDNATFVNNRQTVWRIGSESASPPIEFEITAEVEGVKTNLSESNLGLLKQDESDTLRQEYVDFQIPVPGRSVVVPSLGAGYNRGNYGVQVSIDLPGHYNSVLSAYRGSSVTVNGQASSIPANASITISSGYRNPRRNIAVGSIYPNSRHTKGQALDLVPVPISVLVNGQRTRLSLHGHLYPALATASGGIAEQGATPVPVGDTRENHIHIQW